MSIPLIILSAVLITGAVLFTLAIFALCMTTFVRVTALPSLDMRMGNIEQYLREITERGDDDTGQVRYHTTDGRYSGASTEEVMIKMLEDPNSALPSDQKDALAKFLSQIQKETELSRFFDLDRDDDDDEDSDDGDGKKYGI